MKFSYLEPVKVRVCGATHLGIVLSQHKDLGTVKIIRFSSMYGAVVNDVVRSEDIHRLSESEVLHAASSLYINESREWSAALLNLLHRDSRRGRAEDKKELPPWGADWNNDNWGDKAE